MPEFVGIKLGYDVRVPWLGMWLDWNSVAVFSLTEAENNLCCYVSIAGLISHENMLVLPDSRTNVEFMAPL